MVVTLRDERHRGGHEMEYRNWKTAKLQKGAERVDFFIVLEPQIARSIHIRLPDGTPLECTVPQGRRVWREYRAKGFERKSKKQK